MGAAISFLLGDQRDWPDTWPPISTHGHDDSGGPNEANTPHIPTESNVLDVKNTLLDYLPLELVNIVLDDAEYWPVLICYNESMPVRSIAAISFPQHTASYCYFISPKLPGTSRLDGVRFKVNKLVFRIRSRDQGWGGDPGLTEPYAGSWTWFEAAIVRGLGGAEFINEPDTVVRQIQGSSVLPPAPNAPTTGVSPGPIQVPHPFNRTTVWMLQRNLRANRAEALHEVAWTNADEGEPKEDTNEVLDRSGRGAGYGFVRSLEPCDRIAIYVRAQYPGWVNHVRGVEIRIFYSA